MLAVPPRAGVDRRQRHHLAVLHARCFQGGQLLVLITDTGRVDQRNVELEEPLAAEEVNVGEQSSGLSALVKNGDTIVGGTDPRREGVVLGG